MNDGYFGDVNKIKDVHPVDGEPVLRTFKNRSGYQVEKGSHDWLVCELFFNHLTEQGYLNSAPVKESAFSLHETEACKENAALALEWFETKIIGSDPIKITDSQFHKWRKQIEIIRQILGWVAK